MAGTLRSATRRGSLSVADLVKRIEAGPQGPKNIVVFDFDGTLIAGYSASAFFQAHLRKGEYNAFDLAEAGVAIWQSVAKAIEMQDLLGKAIAKKIEAGGTRFDASTEALLKAAGIG